MSPWARISRAQATRHPAQLALCALGIALGVAVVFSIDLVSASALRSFELGARSVSGEATHRIRAGAEPLRAALYTELRLESEWRAGARVPMAPLLEGAIELQRVDAGATSAAWRSAKLYGIDPHAQPPLGLGLAALAQARDSARDAHVEDASASALDSADRAPRASALDSADPTPDASALGSADRAPRAIALGVDLTRSLGLEPGARVRARGSRAATPVEFTLAQTLAGGDPWREASLAGAALVELEAAQLLLARPGELSAIDLVLSAGDPALERLAARLPAGLRLESTQARASELERMTRAFRLNLEALSWLALLVGVFLVGNALNFAVLQRQPQLALLRALGATRRELAWLVLGEALWVGLLGSVLGLLLGRALSAHLLANVVRTVNDLYFEQSAAVVQLDAAALAKALGLGLGAAALAALAAARQAARVPAALALAQARAAPGALEQARGRWLTGLCAVALALLGGALLARAGPRLLLAHAGLFAIALSFALAAPLALWLALRFAAHGPASVRLAAQGLAHSLPRSAPAVAALQLAIATALALSLLVASFRASVVDWLGRTLVDDVYASSSSAEGIEPELLEVLLALPGVARATQLSSVPVSSAIGSHRAYAFEPAEAALRGLDVRGERTPELAARLAAGEALISEPLAHKLALGVGDRLELRGPRGPVALRIAAIYTDYADERGALALASGPAHALFGRSPAIGLSLSAEPGLEPQDLIERARRAHPRAAQLEWRSNRALREASLIVFDRTFAITDVLRALAGGVALLATLAALLALALERRREYATLRALGLTPGELARLVMLQCALIGSVAGALALPLALALAWILIHVINRESFGWSLSHFSLEPALLARAPLSALGAALLAGVWPAWSLSRAPIAQALREE
jgi:putative ABC transport system permease protein